MCSYLQSLLLRESVLPWIHGVDCQTAGTFCTGCNNALLCPAFFRNPAFCDVVLLSEDIRKYQKIIHAVRKAFVLDFVHDETVR